jgi:glycosyltransferase involved in cell wall biosynthesis
MQMTSEQISICTIISKNYLAHARVLTDSFLKYNPNGTVYVLLTDSLDESFDPKNEKFILFNIKEIGIKNLNSFCFKYDILERNTGVKASFLKFLIKKYNLKKIAYFDPDIFFTNNLENMWKVLDQKSIVLTPHITEHITDNKRPSESEILKSGVYNLGFIAISNSEESKKFLDWWEQKLLDFGYNNVNEGMFTDQKWVDNVPSDFKNVFVINHPGYNVAYWNLMQRNVEINDGRISANGKPMYFFHFSGFVVEDIEIVSKHQNRFRLSNLENLRPLFELYRDLLIDNEFFKTRKWKCFFDYFDNGIRIPSQARRIYSNLLKEDKISENPFLVQKENAFFNYLNENIDLEKPPITQLWYKIYEDREDLHKAFPDVKNRDRAAFFKWIESSGRRECNVDSCFFPTFLNSSQGESKEKNQLEFGINVLGYLKGKFGVAESARNFVFAIKDQKIPFVLNNIDAPIHQNNDETFTEFNTENPYSINLIVANPDQSKVLYSMKGSSYFEKRYNIGVWAWELSEFPEKWISSFKYFDEIWTLSNFVRESVSKNSPIPVFKITCPIEMDESKLVSKRENFGLKNEFVFLLIFDYLSVFERKNPLAVISAFQSTFKDTEKVKLIIKSINGSKFPSEQKKLKSTIKSKNIILYEEHMDKDEILCLLASSDCFVSLHRSEGLGLSIAEAMYASKPVIATNYGGNVDFMNSENSFPVKYELIELEKDHGPYAKGNCWANPNVIHAAELMRYVYDNQEIAKKIGKNASKDIKTNMSFQVSGKEINTRISKIKEQN